MTAPSLRQLGVFLLPILLGSAFLLHATAIFGVGVGVDAVSYLNAAQNLVKHGRLATDFSPGPLQPLTHWPALYPILLVPLYLLSTEPATSARLLNVLLFGVYVAAIQLLVYRATRGHLLTAIGAGFFAAFSYDVMRIFSRIYSETLFLPLFLLGVLALGNYLTRPRWPSLYSAALLFALAWLARYVGVTLLITGCLAILLWSTRAFRMRVRDSLVFCVLVTTPMSLLVIRNYGLTQNLADRSLGIHIVSLSWWNIGIDTIGIWLVPASSPVLVERIAGVAIMASFVLGLYFVLLDNRQSRLLGITNRPWVYPATLLLFTGVYLSVFWTVVSFADSGRLSFRTLSPIFASMIVVAAYALTRLIEATSSHRRTVSLMALLVSLLLITFQSVRTTKWSLAAHDSGFDYTGAGWQSSLAIEALQELPDSSSVFSNTPEVVYFVGGRQTRVFGRTDCRESCSALEQVLHGIIAGSAGDHSVVWVPTDDHGQCGPCVEKLAPKLGLELAERDDRAWLYQGSGKE